MTNLLGFLGLCAFVCFFYLLPRGDLFWLFSWRRDVSAVLLAVLGSLSLFALVLGFWSPARVVLGDVMTLVLGLCGVAGVFVFLSWVGSGGLFAWARRYEVIFSVVFGAVLIWSVVMVAVGVTGLVLYCGVVPGGLL